MWWCEAGCQALCEMWGRWLNVWCFRLARRARPTAKRSSLEPETRRWGSGTCSPNRPPVTADPRTRSSTYTPRSDEPPSPQPDPSRVYLLVSIIVWALTPTPLSHALVLLTRVLKNNNISAAVYQSAWRIKQERTNSYRLSYKRVKWIPP